MKFFRGIYLKIPSPFVPIQIKTNYTFEDVQGTESQLEHTLPFFKYYFWQKKPQQPQNP